MSKRLLEMNDSVAQFVPRCECLCQCMVIGVVTVAAKAGSSKKVSDCSMSDVCWTQQVSETGRLRLCCSEGSVGC